MNSQLQRTTLGWMVLFLKIYFIRNFLAQIINILALPEWRSAYCELVNADEFS
jgi:hypothetical protein